MYLNPAVKESNASPPETVTRADAAGGGAVSELPLVVESPAQRRSRGRDPARVQPARGQPGEVRGCIHEPGGIDARGRRQKSQLSLKFEPQQKAVPSRLSPQVWDRPTLMEPKVIALALSFGVLD